MARKNKEDIRIEFPCSGATYADQKYGVYKYDEYPRGSVLEGQTRRTFLDSFETEGEAMKAYPDAMPGCGCGSAPPYLGHLPDGPDL